MGERKPAYMQIAQNTWSFELWALCGFTISLRLNSLAEGISPVSLFWWQRVGLSNEVSKAFTDDVIDISSLFWWMYKDNYSFCRFWSLSWQPWLLSLQNLCQKTLCLMVRAHFILLRTCLPGLEERQPHICMAPSSWLRLHIILSCPQEGEDSFQSGPLLFPRSTWSSLQTL